MRMALLFAKLALIRIISDFRVLPGTKMKKELVIDPLNMQAMPKGGIWLKFERRS